MLKVRISWLSDPFWSLCSLISQRDGHIQFGWWLSGPDVESFEARQAQVVIYFSFLGFVTESDGREEVKVCSF